MKKRCWVLALDEDVRFVHFFLDSISLKQNKTMFSCSPQVDYIVTGKMR